MKSKFIFDILSNPDGLTYSSKRVGGFISLLCTAVMGFINYATPMAIMASLTAAFFGLATKDYMEYLKQNPTPTDPATGETPVNP